MDGVDAEKERRDQGDLQLPPEEKDQPENEESIEKVEEEVGGVVDAGIEAEETILQGKG